jgi:hypothetical protein
MYKITINIAASIVSSRFSISGNTISLASLTRGDSDGILCYIIILSEFDVNHVPSGLVLIHLQLCICVALSSCFISGYGSLPVSFFRIGVLTIYSLSP